MDIILEELLSSSSSSSSSSTSEDYESSSSEGENIFKLQKFIFAKEKRHCVINFVGDAVNNYSDEEFRQNFRVSRSTAKKLIEQYSNSRHYSTKVNCGGKPTTSAEVKCLSFLWFAGNKNSYREVSNLFHTSISSTYRNLISFLEFLYDISPDHIKMPSTSCEKNEISGKFEKIAGFGNVLGCIDGCYLYIRKPVDKIRSTYVNRHGLISITLQGICDADKKFLDVYVGSPSKIHDSRIYDMSFISKDIPTICGNRYHLLGDAAYPLREYLLTPYRDYGDLSNQQKKYNKKHCQTRVKIENCFGLLKQRFRQLARLDFFTVERMCKFILGCCVLHNMCITDGDLWTDFDELNAAVGEERQTESITTSVGHDYLPDNVMQHIGQLKRDSIAENM